ncbi:hypothetical protein ACIQ1D_19265 [Lysinibacillus xylanilyticus]|uniref:hypothetical protein n=1 Tax=Lysinibacillus xylanilyticus TaxID=582475 RepID=UPI0037FA91E7
MTIKITNAQFDLMKAISPIVDSKDKVKKKELKFALLELIQEALGDKWYNLKKATKQALQHFCMRCVEQGFCFCSPKYFHDNFGVGISTIYDIFKILQEHGVLLKVNRTATSHNGKGNGVYMFIEHPNFEALCTIIDLNWKADKKADWKAENAETPTLPKAESVEKVSTYSLPSSLQYLRDSNVIHYNVVDTKNIPSSSNIESSNLENKKTTKWQKYVPKAINEKFGYFGNILTELWRKIKLAERKVKDDSLESSEKLSVAQDVLTNLRQHPRFKLMSLDEMCRYVYKGQLNGLFNLIAVDHLEDIENNEPIIKTSNLNNPMTKLFANRFNNIPANENIDESDNVVYRNWVTGENYV